MFWGWVWSEGNRKMAWEAANLNVSITSAPRGVLEVWQACPFFHWKLWRPTDQPTGHFRYVIYNTYIISPGGNNMHNIKRTRNNICTRFIENFPERFEGYYSREKKIAFWLGGGISLLMVLLWPLLMLETVVQDQGDNLIIYRYIYLSIYLSNQDHHPPNLVYSCW